MAQKREDIFASTLRTERLALTNFDFENQEDVDFFAKVWTMEVQPLAPTDGRWTALDLTKFAYSVMLKPSELNGRLAKNPPWYTVRLGDAGGTRIGIVILCRRTPDIPPDMGWAILKDYRQQGYAAEATQGLFDYLTKEAGLKEIAVMTDEENTPSKKMAKKMGFVDGGWTIGPPGDSKEVAFVLPGMAKLNGQRHHFWGDGEQPE